MNEKLKKLRLAKGYTQKQLADLSGVSYRAIQELESDKIMHTNTTQAIFLYKISKILDCSIEDLLMIN